MATKKPSASKRITLDLPMALYTRLEALAEAERRELKAQLLVIVERAVKMHEGKKRSSETRRIVNSIFKGER